MILSDLSNLVCSLEVSQELKKAGFYHRTELLWTKGKFAERYSLADVYLPDLSIAAPTAAELLEHLPIGVSVSKQSQGYVCTWSGQPPLESISTRAEKKVEDALANLYIYLKENEFIAVR